MGAKWAFRHLVSFLTIKAEIWSKNMVKSYYNREKYHAEKMDKKFPDLSKRNVQDLPQEIWKDVVEVGYNGLYKISNFGRIKSMPNKANLIERLVNTNRLVNGYYVITLYRYGKFKKVYYHRALAKAFIPNPENKPYINHIDNNPSNNAIENLEWCTQKENSIHAKNQNRINRGEARWSSKLKETDVLTIFNSTERNDTLSKKYKVRDSVISNIKHGKAWAWLTSNQV